MFALCLWKHAPALPGGINSLKKNQISTILLLAPFVMIFNIFFFNLSVSESLVRENVSHYQLGGCQTWEVFVSYCSPCPSCCAGFVPEPEMRRALGKRCYRVGGWLVAPYMVPPKKCPGKSDLHPPGTTSKVQTGDACGPNILLLLPL